MLAFAHIPTGNCINKKYLSLDLKKGKRQAARTRQARHAASIRRGLGRLKRRVRYFSPKEGAKNLPVPRTRRAFDPVPSAPLLSKIRDGGMGLFRSNKGLD